MFDKAEILRVFRTPCHVVGKADDERTFQEGSKVACLAIFPKDIQSV